MVKQLCVLAKILLVRFETSLNLKFSLEVPIKTLCCSRYSQIVGQPHTSATCSAFPKCCVTTISPATKYYLVFNDYVLHGASLPVVVSQFNYTGVTVLYNIIFNGIPMCLLSLKKLEKRFVFWNDF